MGKTNLPAIEKLYTDEEYLAFEREAEENTNLLTAKLSQWRARAKRSLRIIFY